MHIKIRILWESGEVTEAFIEETTMPDYIEEMKKKMLVDPFRIFLNP